MKYIKVVLENLSNQGIILDSEQISFINDFVEQDLAYQPPTFFFIIKSII